MRFVGVDLHKQSISLCVMSQAASGRKVVDRKRFVCEDEAAIADYFASLGPYQVVVEATASYEWFVQLVEPTAGRVVLAHPKKLRIIAESAKKTDNLDAQVLAEFLALDMIPEAWRPTPRVREHRTLVRLRRRTTCRITAAKNSLRRVLADYNADIRELFTQRGRQYLAKIKLSAATRFQVDLLCEELDQYADRLKRIDGELAKFAERAPVKEREARDVLATMPGVGVVTIDVVLAELGDPQRFRSHRKATAFAGLAPGIRQSAGKSRQLGITKEGSPLLRWALVQAAWRVIRFSRRWQVAYQRLKQRCGGKKAIVAIARRLLGVMLAMLHKGEAYRPMTLA